MQTPGYHHGHHGSGHGQEAFCVCPGCQQALRHVPGVPCNARLCPNCGHSLFKSYDPVHAQHLKGIADEDAADFAYRPIKRSVFPLVHASLCVTCDKCFDVCPVDAIEYRNGKAFIIEEKCRNCKACVSACPSQAIEP